MFISPAAPRWVVPLSSLSDEALVPLPTARRDYLGGITAMTEWRWRKDERIGFPPVIQIRKRNYVSGKNLKAFVARLSSLAA